MVLLHAIGVILILSPMVLGFQCKTDLNQPSDGWVLFRGNGLSYNYYDLSKTTAAQFPSLETSNNPLAKTVKAVLTSNADYFAYTNDLKTFSKELDSVPNKNGIVSVTSAGKGIWLMYSNVFFPPLSSDQKSFADPTSNLWTWLDLTPSKSAYFACVTLKGKHHLIKLMNLLASSNAFVHINKMGTSSPFKAYITIDKNKPATTLNKEKALTKECRYSMPSTLGQKCYMSATFSGAKISVFSRHRLTTPTYHQFCFEAKNQKAVVQSKPLWPNFPGHIPQSQIIAVTVPGASPLACVGDLLNMKDKPGKSSLLVCFEHQKLWSKLKLEGLESVEHCLPHETSGNITVLSTVLPELPKFNVSYFLGGYYRQSVASILKDKEMYHDDIGSIKMNTFKDESFFFEPLEGKSLSQQPVRSRKRQKKARPAKRTVVEVEDLLTFDEKVRHNDDPVLALFCYDWCRYCRKFKSQFKKMANDPSFRHISFVDVDLKLNHLPEAFNVLLAPTLRYKPASHEVNSQTRRYSDYDLAGYRTIEGQLSLKNVLEFIQIRDQITATTKHRDKDDWATSICQAKHHKESTRGKLAKNSTLQRIVMMNWKDETLRNSSSRGTWIGLFTKLIDGLVGIEKPQRFQLTNDDLKTVLRDLEKLKHHKTEKQWVENPLVRNVLGENTGKSRPSKEEREVFKVMCKYVSMAITDTDTELQRMMSNQKMDDLQTFSSFKNNLDKQLKILKGKMKKEKRIGKLHVKPVQEILKHVGLLQPREISHFVCSK